MRFPVLTLVMLSLFTTLGYLGCSSATVQWDKNLAIYASSKDSKFHDDNLYTAGETAPLISEAKDQKSVEEADAYTQATLEWGKPQQIQGIIVKAEPGQLEFFEIQYQDDEGNWQTIRRVSDHYREDLKHAMREPVYTRKLRLKVPRVWESRRVGGQKRRTRGEGGAPPASYKKIREIEVYPPLLAAEPTIPQ